ncbi:hypothetical protein RRG08_005012 [Elysia crispata]|uniref:Uncharacterized protein n=1 Tax=Elysia crispata TaxID=231223 RepID=A0AAE1E8W1_9GAST|nr:hypothetical protein RRG08_005012 [Elysia crispata]
MYTSAAACKQLHVTQYNKFSLGLQCGKLYISNVSSGLWRSHPVLIPWVFLEKPCIQAQPPANSSTLLSITSFHLVFNVAGCTSLMLDRGSEGLTQSSYLGYF